MDRSFPCNSCGVCCKQLAHIPELSSFNRGDGTCIHLSGTTCSIYETRPEICSVDKMYEAVYHKEMSREAFYLANLRVCKQLQTEAGLPESQHVKLPESANN